MYVATVVGRSGEHLGYIGVLVVELNSRGSRKAHITQGGEGSAVEGSEGKLIGAHGVLATGGQD